MARTFRRTRATYLFDRYTRDTVWERSTHGGLYLREVDLSPNDPSYRHGWLCMHTDRGGYSLGNAPGWFRRLHNRTRRSKQNQAVRQGWHNEDLQVPPFRRDVNWHWW